MNESNGNGKLVKAIIQGGAVGISVLLILFMFYSVNLLNNKFERNNQALTRYAIAVEKLTDEVINLSETNQRQTDKITDILILISKNGNK